MLHITTTSSDRKGNIRYKLFEVCTGKIPKLISWHKSYEAALKSKKLWEKILNK